MNDFGVYVILTKPHLPHTVVAERCVRLGVKMLQLREKGLSDRELIRLACDLRSVTKGTATRFVVNDRPDVAVLCGADYLHIGQDDFSVEDARKIVGDMGIGLSTHSIQQAREALEKKPDYIGFGPIYPTNAKAKPDEPVGTEQLKQVLTFADVPVVAIGGIFPENVQDVVCAGARNIALVRYFMQTTEREFEKRIKDMEEMLFRC